MIKRRTDLLTLSWAICAFALFVFSGCQDKIQTPPVDQIGQGVVDKCPDDPNKTEPGQCGCGVAETDFDEDNVPDCLDKCPRNKNKTDPGLCNSCEVSDEDNNGDGVPDCLDNCPNDPMKVDPGFCGCGLSERDQDGDTVPACIDKDGNPQPSPNGDHDECDGDPDKVTAGLCGCKVPGAADDIPGVDEDDLTDPRANADGDNSPDCVDECDNDPDKALAGACGCGVPDIDNDGDGHFNCAGAGPDLCDDVFGETDPGPCNDCNATAQQEADPDGDGYANCVDECDNNGNVAVVRSEICDGIDNNCDGTIDNLAAGACQEWDTDPDNSTPDKCEWFKRDGIVAYDDPDATSEEKVNPWPFGTTIEARYESFGNDHIEPSGLVSVPELNEIFMVHDEGWVLRLSPGDLNVIHDFQNAAFGGDPEGITHIPGTDTFFVAFERRDGSSDYIEEFKYDETNNSFVFQSGRRWVLDGLVNTFVNNRGVTAITFVPRPLAPQGGVFYVGTEVDGLIYCLKLFDDDVAGGGSKRVEHCDPSNPEVAPPSEVGSGLTALTWDRSTMEVYPDGHAMAGQLKKVGMIYGVSDQGSKMMAFDPEANRYKYIVDLPKNGSGTPLTADQEGFTLDVDCNVYVGQDSPVFNGNEIGRVSMFAPEPKALGCLTGKTLTKFNASNPGASINGWPFSSEFVDSLVLDDIPGDCTNPPVCLPPPPAKFPNIEASGVINIPGTEKLFVIGDDGQIVNVTTSLVKPEGEHSLIGNNNEGVTFNPATPNLMYVVREDTSAGGGQIKEIDHTDPTNIFVVDVNGDEAGGERIWDIPNDATTGVPVGGGDGVTGLAFVPNDISAEGGYFYVGSEFDGKLRILEVDITSNGDNGYGVRRIGPDLPRPGTNSDYNALSAVHFDASSGFIYALWNQASVVAVYDTTADNELLYVFQLDQNSNTLSEEGFAFDGECNVYVADDSIGSGFGAIRKYSKN